MGAPVLARLDERGDRFYTWAGETFWSVTTLIDGGIPKYGLPPWYARTTAELAYADLESRGPYAGAHPALRRWARRGRLELAEAQAAGGLTSIDPAKLTDRDFALRWLVAEPGRLRDKAGETGIQVHDEAEAAVLRLALDSADRYVDGLAIPAWPGLDGYREGFVNWLTDWRPEFEATEATVFHRGEAYAGTFDAIIRVTIGGVLRRLLIDYKSGRQVYPEVGMQTAAYRRGQFIGSPDRVTEIPMIATDDAAVLHLKPKATRAAPRGYVFRLVRSDDEIFRSFLFAREGYRWGRETSRTVIRDPLEPPAKEAA